MIDFCLVIGAVESMSKSNLKNLMSRATFHLGLKSYFRMNIFVENKPVSFEESRIFDELEAFCIRSFSLNLFVEEITSKSSEPNLLPLIPFSFIGVVGGPILSGREFSCGEAGDRGGLRII